VEKLRVGIIGLGGSGQTVLRALRGGEWVEIVGLADREASVADRFAAETKVPAFGDGRSLLARCSPQAVFLAVPQGEAPGLVGACVERGVHVWKDLPLARNLDEAVAMTEAAERAALRLAVGTQRRFMPGYRSAWERRNELGGVFLARAHYMFNWGRDLSWHADQAAAGGGALLELGYHMVDLIVWALGLPEEVYGLTGLGHRPGLPEEAGKSLPAYDTDDTACAVFHYTGGRMACLATSRYSDPVSEELALHGRAGSVTAGAETCILRNADGVVIEQISQTCTPLDAIRRELEAFVQAVTTGGERYACSARENLLTQATVDAIYLAARTGQPESPARLLHTHRLKAADCLKYCPVD
jgi:predicted dehydrogenase